MVRGLKFRFLDMHNPAALFWAFLLCHFIVWTLTPIGSLPNGPLDVIELLNWGSHWQWGYEKHPPFPAWVAEAFVQIAGKRIWGAYVASQIAICACFLAVWLLARDFLNPLNALLSVLLLEGLFYYNYASVEFRHDVVQLPIWSWTVLLFWRSLNSGRMRYWLLCGVTIGLGLLSKYNMIFLLVALLAFMLVNARARRHFATPGLYIAIAIAGLMFAPHVVWLFENDFMPVRYALARAQSQRLLIDHLVNPLRFAGSQALAFVPVIIILRALMFRSGVNAGGDSPEKFPRAFLFTVAVGPFLAYLAISAIIGFKLRSMWGTPLWSFIGVFILFLMRPAITPKALHRFTYAFSAVAAIWVIAFVGQSALAPRLIGGGMRRHFPGQAIAHDVTALWVKNYGTPLSLVGGDRWLAENIGFYSPDRPDVYVDLDRKKSPWTNDEAFKQRGGVIIWDAVKDGNALPDPWRKRFPGALVQPTVSFAWQTSTRVPPVQIGWAFVAPAS